MKLKVVLVVHDPLLQFDDNTVINSDAWVNFLQGVLNRGRENNTNTLTILVKSVEKENSQ